MCGIGGIIRLSGAELDAHGADRERLQAMRRVLACRGPDGHGLFFDGPCGLVHTRLAILDKVGGDQPMTRGDLTVVFNGEIYNHRQLRTELQAEGYAFESDHSDTEVLLHGFHRWGERLPQALDGMFAFLIWDRQRREVFAARDRMGKKPLYFATQVGAAGREWVFASTPAAIAAAAARKGLTIQNLAEYLTLGYAADVGPERLKPAESICFSLPTYGSRGEMCSMYWIAGGAIRPVEKQDLPGKIEAAVHRRLEADVPLGCFLSGGIDSSLVAAIAQRKLADRGERLKTFCLSMPDARYDEGPWARKVAEHLGCEHKELRCEPNVEEDLRTLIRTMGEPFADSSILPTYWLSKATCEHVTVALSGDGGDELFGGYERYLAMGFLRKYGWLISRVPSPPGPFEQKSWRAKLRRLVEAARRKSPDERYLSIVQLFSNSQLRELGLEPLRRPESLHHCFASEEDPMEAARIWDVENYLPNDLLCKVDRASMAVGLEVRCPLLDTAVVRAAMNTPMNELLPGRITKPVLRALAREYLPRDVVDRPKMGFAVPIGHWFRNELRPMLYKWLRDAPHLKNLGIGGSVELLLAEHTSGRFDHSHRLFALLSLSMWCEEFGGSGS